MLRGPDFGAISLGPGVNSVEPLDCHPTEKPISISAYTRSFSWVNLMRFEKKFWTLYLSLGITGLQAQQL